LNAIDDLIAKLIESGSIEEIDRTWAFNEVLDAVQAQEDPRWNLLRGRVYMEEGKCREAARCLHIAETRYPKETAPLLERCYRELQDYKRAYEYACMQK